jgi:hypothetical protein
MGWVDRGIHRKAKINNRETKKFYSLALHGALSPRLTLNNRFFHAFNA